MQIGVSTHIHVMRKMSPELLSDIKRAGFASVELYCNDPHWPDFDDPASQESIISTCSELGLAINSIHTPFFRTLEHARRGKWYSLSSRDSDVRRESIDRAIDAIAIAEHASVRAAVIHVGAAGEEEDAHTWERMYYSLEEILPVAKEMDITPALENITNDFSRGHKIASFIRESGLEGLGCCYDSGHAKLYDRSLDELREMAPWLVTTHLHDCSGGKDNHLQLYEGEIDWKELAGTFAELEYDGDLIIETKDLDSTWDELVKAHNAAEQFQKSIAEMQQGE